MYCSTCGKQLRDGASFCPFCGTKIEVSIGLDSVSQRKTLQSETAKKVTVKVAQIDGNVKKVKAVKVTQKKESVNQTEKESNYTKTPRVTSNNPIQRKPSDEEITTPSSSFYLADFFKKMFRARNTGVLIYLFINLVIIAAVLKIIDGGTGPESYLLAFGEAILLYGLSLAIALSPIGEWILRFQTGCKEIKRQEQKDYLYPIFNDVYKKAKAKDGTLPDDIKLYIMEDNVPNAFATGRKTICVTTGLLELKPEKIAGTIAHEFGHLAHHDTDMLLLVNVGNFVITAIFILFRTLYWILYGSFSLALVFLGGWDGVIGAILTSVLHFATDVTVVFLVWLWSKIGTFLVMHSSRQNEYAADKFAYDIGYGNELCAALDTICGPGAKGLFATLVSTHPEKDDRIAKLQSYGASYRALIGTKYGIK